MLLAVVFSWVAEVDASAVEAGEVGLTRVASIPGAIHNYSMVVNGFFIHYNYDQATLSAYQEKLLHFKILDYLFLMESKAWKTLTIHKALEDGLVGESVKD
ncbi:hypothetical protein CIK74_00465 [Glutamicibacter sp. BW77]|nr:hypothetical protein CIK74_00465 [Glutamicibacter sp. BW77]